MNVPLLTRFFGFVLCLFILLGASSCRHIGAPVDLEWNELVSPYRHDLQMDGYKLHYIDLGEGEPLLLLHGFASSGYAWNRQVEPLRQAGMRLILVDLPGQGFSDVPPHSFKPTVENIAAEVIKLADHLRLEKFSLLGCSMGGGLTLYLCWKFPERVERAAVIDPASFDQERPWALGLLTNPVTGPVVAQGASKQTVGAGLKDTAVQKQAITDTFVDEYTRPLNKPGYKAFISRLMREFFSKEFEKMVLSYHTLRNPLLILWGKQDPWIPAEFCPRLAALAQNARCETIDECGHMPHMEQPEITARLLTDFFSTRVAE
ncbi:MAG TPA: alpha/beta hydrolase [bacterium]|nr:alpha/beta hydrolase [bacterium]